jgi:hypothetical protein
MKHFHLLALVAIISGISCPVSAQDGRSTAQKRAEEFVWFGGNFFRASKVKPVSTKIKRIKNQHDEGQIDEWHTVSYPGFRVEFLRSKSVPGDLLSTLALFDRQALLPFGLKIGSTEDQIVHVLGSPTSCKPGELEFEIGDIQTASVTFQLKQHMLIGIKWYYEID